MPKFSFSHERDGKFFLSCGGKIEFYLDTMEQVNQFLVSELNDVIWAIFDPNDWDCEIHKMFGNGVDK